MADQKVSDLPSLNGVDVDPADLLYIVDSSAGTAGSKKITIGQFQLSPWSAGTVNGVVYFDGSKVPASSSALTFDGTNLGVGTATPNRRLVVYEASGGAISLNNSTTGVAALSGFQMQIGATTDAYLWNYSNGPLIFGTNNAERVRIDASGNLGLGVTPSAWGSNYKGFELVGGGAGIAANGSNAVTIGTGNYINSAGNWIYTTTGTAVGRYELNSGLHRWYTAPSGTAGNPITFTQAMTLDASGNLLVGATTGYRSGRLVVKDVNRTQTSTLANLHVSTTDSQAADLGGSIGFGGQIGGDEAPLGLISGRKENSTSGNYAGYLAFATSSGSAAIAERARITSGGDLVLGGTVATPSGLGGRSFTVNATGINYGGVEFSRDGNYIAALRIKDTGADNNLVLINNTANALIFGTSNTERARITSAGDFIHQVNGTAPSLSTNGTMSFELTSNTSLKIVVRGTDGVTRSTTLTLT